MSEPDPHIHVEQKVAQAGADFRNVIASTLGVATDAPSVWAGCPRCLVPALRAISWSRPSNTSGTSRKGSLASCGSERSGRPSDRRRRHNWVTDNHVEGVHSPITGGGVISSVPKSPSGSLSTR